MQPSPLERCDSDSKDMLYIFFQDIVDADNLMAIVAHLQHYGAPTKARPLHFVLTQRPENFRHASVVILLHVPSWAPEPPFC